MVKFTTASPEGVYRSSGSAISVPMMMSVVLGRHRPDTGEAPIGNPARRRLIHAVRRLSPALMWSLANWLDR